MGITSRWIVKRGSKALAHSRTHSSTNSQSYFILFLKNQFNLHRKPFERKEKSTEMRDEKK